MKSNKTSNIVLISSLVGFCLWLFFMTSGCKKNPPAAPTGLTATAVSPKQIDLSWTDGSEKVTGFKIERKTGTSGSWTQIDTVSANIKAYQNTGLAPMTTYVFRVKAYNENGESGYSNEASATTLSGATFTPGSDTILITQTLGVQGGTLRGPTGSTLDGVVVNFPAGALQKNSDISLGINSGNLTPASGDWGGKIMVLKSSSLKTFDQPVTITVPFTQNGNILVPYYIDNAKKPHAMTLTKIDRQNKTVTFQTFHASFITWILEKLGLLDISSYGTGYTPGNDGFQVDNSRTFYNRDGECLGMTSFSLWYYENYLSKGHFYNKYMTVIGNDSNGNVLVGQNIIATRAYISISQQWNSYLPKMSEQQNLTEEEQFTSICHALFNTGNPVLIYLYHDQTAGFPDAHSVLAYAYNSNNIYIYDPNYHNTVKTISFNTGNKSWNNYEGYDGIIYNGDGSLNLTEPYTQILNDADNNFHSSADAKINITSHTNGAYVPSRNTTLSGNITSGQVLVTQLEVFVGSTSFKTEVPVDGSFSFQISLRSGVNHLQFVTRGKDADGNLIPNPLPNDSAGALDFTLNGTLNRSIILVTLTWDTNDTDLDLYVIDPTGDYSCYYHKITAAGGELDYDVVTGYGPEHWTLKTSDTIFYNQDYSVRVHYYSDHGNGPSNYTATIQLYEETNREVTYTYRGNLAVSNWSNDKPGDSGEDWRDIARIRLISTGAEELGRIIPIDTNEKPLFVITTYVPPESERIKLKK